MERKIGEIFEEDGKWYQCVEGNGCENCAFKGRKCYLEGGTDDPIGECCYDRRRDNKDVIFKKLEKVGEPMKIHDRLVLKVKADSYKCMRCFFYSKAKCELTMQECEHYDCGEGTKFIEIKQNKEDMEEKKPTYEELLHYYHSTVGLWAIDKNPQEVSLDWICDNAFQLGIDEKDSNSENIGKNLREFNLEAAKAGKPVCTRDGRKARIICFHYKSYDDYSIIALIDTGDNEIPYKYTKEGKFNPNRTDVYDLMMLPEKKEGWVLLRKDGSVFDNEEVAKKNCTNDYFVAKVEWKE